MLPSNHLDILIFTPHIRADKHTVIYTVKTKKNMTQQINAGMGVAHTVQQLFTVVAKLQLD